MTSGGLNLTSDSAPTRAATYSKTSVPRPTARSATAKDGCDSDSACKPTPNCIMRGNFTGLVDLTFQIRLVRLKRIPKPYCAAKNAGIRTHFKDARTNSIDCVN